MSKQKRTFFVCISKCSLSYLKIVQTNGMTKENSFFFVFLNRWSSESRVKLACAMPKYRANESRVKLAWLCRVQPIFNEVNRDRGRRSQCSLSYLKIVQTNDMSKQKRLFCFDISECSQYYSIMNQDLLLTSQNDFTKNKSHLSRSPTTIFLPP